MFSNNEKEQMLKNFEEIISKTYKKKNRCICNR